MRPSKRGLDAGIVVRDVVASLRFYVDVLGLEHVEQLSIPWGTMHRLRFGDSWLKIVDPDEAPPDGAPATGLDAAVGIRYLTFEIDDVEEAWAAAVRGGAPIFHPLGPFGTKGVRAGMVLDPDGNVVELLHRPPAAAVR
jgi:catechol 2,3-dioxygenase-like lactoylglutathione lyase family enzyme